MSSGTLSAADGAFLLSCVMNSTNGGSINWEVVASENGYSNLGSAKNRLAALKKLYAKGVTNSAKSPKKNNSKASPTKAKIQKSPIKRGRGRPRKVPEATDDDDGTPTPKNGKVKQEVKEEVKEGGETDGSSA